MAAALEHQVPLTSYYDYDTRREIFQCNGTVNRLSQSVACLIPEWFLNRNDNGSYTFKNVRNLSDCVKDKTGYALADEAAFRDQGSPGAGTAFAITRNTVMTAGHCAEIIFKYKLKVVFNFIAGKQNFAANEVYDVKNIMYKYSDGQDWGWMELDRDIEGRDTLPVDMSPPENNTFVAMLGHPSGISMKYCDGSVTSTASKYHFNAKLDSSKGNSGSPVFNTYNQVIGILCRGIPDYHFDRNVTV